jgi:FHA domain
MTGPDEPNGAGPATSTWGRVAVHPGSGVVARHDDAVLVVPTVAPAQVDRTAELLGLHQRTPDPTGRRRIRYAAWVVTEAEPGEVPGFALLIRTGAALLILAHGDVEVSVRGPHEETFGAATSLTWVERTVEPPYDEVTVRGPGGTSGTFLTGVPFDLTQGTVPGGGVTVVPATHRVPAPAATAPASTPGTATTPAAVPAPPPERPPPPAPALPPPPPPPPAPPPAAPPLPAPAREPAVTTSQTVLRAADPFRSVRLGGRSPGPGARRRPPLPVGTVPSRTPAPPRPGEVTMVEGVTCRNGHFNDPDAASCSSCGAPLAGSTGRHSEPRPPLGVLVTDDGSVFTVTGDYVIGRDPGRAAAVLSGKAQPLVLQDEEHSCSRVHAYLTLSGWSVLVRDGGSANGTFVSRSGPAGPWTPVPADDGMALHPGDRVRVGKRQLLFDCYHEPLRP